MNLNVSIKTLCSIIDADFIDTSELSINFSIKNIVIDSRSPIISKESLFVILEGSKTNGIHFIPEFVEKGGRIILCQKKVSSLKCGQLIVNDSLEALQKIAGYHRRKFTIPVIGITGSNGKTTVKEWLYFLLKDKYSIVRSPKSYNSQIGVALSVLEMDEGDELAIFEAGISKPNEMANLVEMIQPTIGIFTGLGDAHNKGFKNNTNQNISFEEIEEEKRKEKYLLFQSVDTLIEKKEDFISVHSENSTIKYELQSDKNNFTLTSINDTIKYTSPFSDEASASNVALVCLTGQLFNIETEIIKEKIQELPTISMRLEKIIGINDTIIINDVYNLDEKSLEIGLHYLKKNRAGKRMAIFIGEDENLVNKSSTLLHSLSRFMSQIKIDEVVYFGSKKISDSFNFVIKQYDNVSLFSANPIALKNTTILFTGSRNSHLETVVNYYTEKKHITRLLVNLDGIKSNLSLYKEKLNKKTFVLAMVKAQSYGGGILEVAQFLEAEKVDYFGVAYADEGVVLRKGGIKIPILVMNPEPAAFDDMIDYDLEPSIYSIDLLNAFVHQLILRQKKNFAIHIKLDTGMNRLGFRENDLNDTDLKELLEMVAAQPEVYVRSVFSHLSVAEDKKETAFTKNQIASFIKQSAILEKGLGYTFIRHLANSAGAYYHPEAEFDMVRLGIGLFGLLEKNQSDFENVLTLKSQISQIRKISTGESVGYGRSYKAEKNTKIGIVPVGYSDGLRRRLGNGNWSVSIAGKSYPIIGNICMDMCMVDLGNDSIKEGDDVELFGNSNSIFEMSEVLDTIPYEIISSISGRVQRVYLEM